MAQKVAGSRPVSHPNFQPPLLILQHGGLFFSFARPATGLFPCGRNVMADNASPHSGTRPGDGLESNCEKKDKIETGGWDLTVSCCILSIYTQDMGLLRRGVGGACRSGLAAGAIIPAVSGEV